jgi:radical SAM protein with 4Fe4S-binding SPASM domain
MAGMGLVRAFEGIIKRARPTLTRRGVAGLPALYRQHLAVERRPEVAEHRINALQIEPTKRCNQRCPMCTQPTLSDDEKGDMTFEQFRSILDQLPDLTELKLQGLGEILLNRDIWKMLDYAVERHIRVLFADNALLMTEKASRELCRLENVDVRFSIDSLDRERYARIRGVDTLERATRNVRRFAAIRREHGRRRLGRWMPSAEIRMVCMDENLHELPDMVRFAADVGLEKVTATFMLSKKHSPGQSEFVQSMTEKLHEEGLNEVEATARAEAQRRGVQLKTMPYTKDILANCEWPWRMPYVTYDGYVTSCCHVEKPEAGNFGNLFESSFEEIWNGPAYRAFRRHFTDLSKNEVCRVCPFLTPEQVAPYRTASEEPQHLISAERLLSRGPVPDAGGT